MKPLMRDYIMAMMCCHIAVKTGHIRLAQGDLPKAMQALRNAQSDLVLAERFGAKLRQSKIANRNTKIP